MKIVIDLPAALVRKLKIHAARQGRLLDGLIADYLRNGLPTPRRRAIFTKDKKTGFPVIVTPSSRKRRKELTPDDIAQILLDQEVEWHLQAIGHKR